MNDLQTMRVHVEVEGRVQGVGFRAFVVDQAFRLGVYGWVRNRWIGTVEVVAEGDHTALEQLIAALREGPPASHVTHLNLEWQAATGEFHQFSMRSSF
jgi:acylphosphatase